MISSRTHTLLASLLSAAPLRHHILTVLMTQSMSTAVEHRIGG